jgi:hypothetical protein
VSKSDGNNKRQWPNLTRDPSRSDVPDSPLHEQLLKLILQNSVEHLHGPEEIDYDKDELVVLCLVRNGRHYLKSFLEHYFSLGAKHIVFLDNESTDGTVEFLQGYDNVTVIRSTLPYGKYLITMKRYLIERFGRDRWTLMVDIDELFDYPYSDVVSLRSLLGYLNENSYTAMVSYMLEMFPEEILSEDSSLPEDEPLKELHRFYDISNVHAQSYHTVGDIGNVLADEEVELLRGGVRYTLFGNRALLVKHPLVFLDDEIKLMDLSDHWVGNARVADLTGVLLHYKFSNRFYEDVRRSVGERNRLNVGSGRYSKYLKVLNQSPTLKIKQETARELESVNDLVSNRFARVSEEYLRFAAGKGLGNDGEDFLKSYSETMLNAFLEARIEERRQRQRADDLQRQLESRNYRRVEQLQTELEAERREKQSEHQKVQAIQSSRSWRILVALSRIKKAGMAVLGLARRMMLERK